MYVGQPRCWLFFFVLFGWSTLVNAQNERLDLTDVCLLALRQHPSIVIRQDGILAAESDLAAAQWQRFPSLGVDLNTAVAQNTEAGQKTDRLGATLRVQQPIWSGGRIDAEIDAARVRHGLAEVDKRQAEQDLLSRVVEVYIEHQRWQARLRVAEENLLEHRRLLALIERRTDQKVSSRADLALAQARLQQALAEQQGFRLGEQKTLHNLSQLLGVRVQGEDLRPAPLNQIAWPDLPTALQAAEVHSPHLQRLQAEVALAQVDVATRRAVLYPQLSLRYEKFTGSAQTSANDRLMLALEYQPGAGLGSLSSAKAAARRVSMASGGVELGLRELSDRVGEAFNEWQIFATQRSTAEDYAAATRDVMASYLRQFTVGRKTWQEVLNAQREVAQSAYAAIDTIQGEILASYRLAILTGQLSPASLIEQKQK
jgi:adhesin transport system outer membrane protein